MCLKNLLWQTWFIEPLFLTTRTKLASVAFVAAGNSMWQQVLDDAKVSTQLSQISPQRHATFSTRPTVPSTTPYYKVLKSASPILFCATKYYTSTTLYYKALLQLYSVLPSTIPVLLQYYSVLQSTTVLLRATKYYSSTTLYYKVLLCTTQNYNVLLCTTPVLLQYYKVLLQ